MVLNYQFLFPCLRVRVKQSSNQNNDHRYPLLIATEKTDVEPSMAAFSYYGLSNDCSVPLF
ncbi:type I-F CRISPR-associated endoribonuclease Cas6/Csy4 [Methylotuvimicrobium buryatense]|uniref:Type I-F CRISPR-associated endoribonuclease Cas6/Csy4 n=1 Tax=Methylotuvimicrobium buryatense TaxID=95641 RepID=A0A4P9UPC7_METBY|nr:type I-F CRISPR-associated endoribonuclease Cas6/Csy4 [Methylotuvimicrobium buryatense]